MQGFSMQGFKIQGFSLQGFSLQGFSLQGFSLQAFSLQGSEISGFKVETVGGEEVLVPVAGEELVGTEITVRHDESETDLTLRIDDIRLDPESDTDDVYFYTVTYLNPETGDWEPTCPDAPGNESILLSGMWDAETGDRIEDADTFSFACRNGVIAKCTEWGYRPWAEQEGQSLAPYHQACTRMARADYCGDGTPHTVNGVTIDIEDQLDTSIQSYESWWPFEAEWNEDGAVCLNAWNSRIWLMDDIQLPSCLQEIAHKPKCGWKPSAETLMVDRFSFLYNWWNLH
ncbi:MAG: hypothetical protein H6713_16635 [Myxococcales bacterium]|nr:hypothetical protein [Myxococcales bacterium]